MSYTGPITVVTFTSTVDPRDRFAVTFHTLVEDLDSIETIIKRYAEDGYKPDLSSVRRWFMLNGVIEDRQPAGPAGFSKRSAFLRT